MLTMTLNEHGPKGRRRVEPPRPDPADLPKPVEARVSPVSQHAVNSKTVKQKLAEVNSMVESFMVSPGPMLHKIDGRVRWGLMGVDAGRVDRIHGVLSAIGDAESFKKPGEAFETLYGLYGPKIDFDGSGRAFYLLTRAFGLQRSPDQFLKKFVSMDKSSGVSEVKALRRPTQIATVLLDTLDRMTEAGVEVPSADMKNGLRLLKDNPLVREGYSGFEGFYDGKSFLNPGGVFVASTFVHPQGARQYIARAKAIRAGTALKPSAAVEEIRESSSNAVVSLSVDPRSRIVRVGRGVRKSPNVMLGRVDGGVIVLDDVKSTEPLASRTSDIERFGAAINVLNRSGFSGYRILMTTEEVPGPEVRKQLKTVAELDKKRMEMRRILKDMRREM